MPTLRPPDPPSCQAGAGEMEGEGLVTTGQNPRPRPPTHTAGPNGRETPLVLLQESEPASPSETLHQLVFQDSGPADGLGHVSEAWLH